MIYGIILNLNEKINSLEKTIENLNKHEIKIINSEKEPTGICLEINAIKNSDFGKYFGENKNYEEKFYFQMNFNLKKSNNLSDEIEKIINLINSKQMQNNAEFIIEKKENLVSINYSKPLKLDKEVKLFFNFLKYCLGTDEQKNFKFIFKSELQIKDIFNIENFEEFYKKIIICHFILKDLTNNGKLFLINLINYLNSKLKYEKIEGIQNDIPFLILFFSWRELTLPDPENFFKDILDIIKVNFNDNINNIYLALKQILSICFDISNPFWNKFSSGKNIKFLLDKISFEEISLIIPIYQLNIGYVIKLRLKGIKDLIEDKIIKKFEK